MTPRSIIVLAVAILIGLSFSTSFARCEPSFPYRDGWLGGDAVYSVPLNGNRVLWLFADSFVGSPGNSSRANARMISNTIALSGCSAEPSNLRYYWRGDRESEPRAFFDSATDAYRFWPADGFLFEGALYVFLTQIGNTGKGLFDFKEVGAKIAAVGNPSANPDRWAIRYFNVTNTQGIIPGAAVIIAEPWAYFHTVVHSADRKTHRVILARMALPSLHAGDVAVEYLDNSGNWKRGFDVADAKVLIDDAAPEFSVHYHPALKRWVMVQTDSKFPPTQVGIRTAETVEGPWTPFKPLSGIPEMEAPNRDADTFCYAAKEHIEFALGSTLYVTYVCNSLSLAKQVRDLSLYRPRILRLDLGELRAPSN